MRNDMTLIVTFPAYNIYVRTPDHEGVTDISVADTLGTEGRGYWNAYSPGSVVSYSLKAGLCPIKGVERAKASGHRLHWINQDSVCVTAHRQPQKTLIAVKPGMKVRFEGRVFEIVKEPNNNLGLKETETA